VDPAKQAERWLGSAELVGVIVLLGAEDEAQIECLQLADVRGIGGEAVFDDDRLQMRMRAAQVRQQALGGVALAVVLARAVSLGARSIP